MSFISSGFSHNIRQLGANPLTDDQLRALVPSAFAEHAHESRSERFAYIPTSNVIDGLRANGFVPTFAKQGKSRIEGKEDFTKHLIRFRKVDAKPTAKYLGQTYPEVILCNAHDGTSSYQIHAGLFRLVCLNGMVRSDSTLSNLKISHKGDVVSKVIDGTYEVLSESHRALDAAESWATISLNRDEQMILADTARTIRFSDNEGVVRTPIRAEQMLEARRREDHGNDLWSTFQRVQENSLRGGLTAYGRDSNNNRRRTTTRDVNGIDQDMKLNKALWALTTRMAEIKSSH